MARGERAGHIARKRFGQHFLTDPFVIDAIVDAIDPQAGDALVEIGPGLGALTNPLLARCGRLTVIELDRDLAARLRRRPELDVIEADVLRVDLAELAARIAGLADNSAQGASGGPSKKLRMVGNLPYNISTPILFHLLEFSACLADQHFMLQKEVVDRMVAAPGTKAYGRLTVMLQWCCSVEAVLDVPPEAFDPPPRVESAVVRLQPLGVDPLAAPVDAKRLGELVGVAFSQRRKILRGTLGRWLEAQGFAGTFDDQRRAEEVPVAEYVALSRAVARP